VVFDGTGTREAYGSLQFHANALDVKANSAPTSTTNLVIDFIS
jgi:hypothetical protein